MKTQPASNGKFWAVLSHLAALAGGLGMIIPAFGWSESRQRSGYAAFQSLQALGYQSLGYTLWTAAYLLILLVMLIVSPPPVREAVGPDAAELRTWLGVHVLVTLGLFGVYLLVPVIGALMCAFGRDFRYPILGNRLARFIGYDPGSPDAALNEQHEERFAASMGHFSVIFPLTGMLVPIALWATQGSRSRYMKFQALQTIIFQAIAALVTLLLAGLAVVILAAALLVFFSAPDMSQPSIESLFGAFILLICLAVILLIVPLFQILGQWAGLRILLGHDYHYPLIGRWVENWLAKREADGL
jgi:uncharacterized Tic20 family protein